MVAAGKAKFSELDPEVQAALRKRKPPLTATVTAGDRAIANYNQAIEQRWKGG